MFIPSEFENEKLKMFALCNSAIFMGKKPSYKEFDFKYLESYNREKVSELLHSDKHIFLTVCCSKEELCNFKNNAANILELEWVSPDLFKIRIRLGNKECSRGVISVRLGPSFNLTFTDFQLCGNMAQEELETLFQGKDWTLTQFVKILAKNCVSEANSNAWKETFTAQSGTVDTEREISEFKLDDFVFSRERIRKYCTAFDDPNCLGFVLTYRIDDLLIKMAEGEGALKAYLKACPKYEVHPRLSALFSLQYPTYLQSYRNFLCRIVTDMDDSGFQKDWCLSAEKRKKISLKDYQDARQFMMDGKNGEILEVLEALQELKSQKPTADEWSRALRRKDDPTAKNWQNEDILLYAIYREQVNGADAQCFMEDLFTCFKQVEGLEMVTQLTRQELNDKQCKEQLLPANKIFICVKNLFASPEVNSNSNASFLKASFAEYLYGATWRDGKKLTLTDRIKNEDGTVYAAYLRCNMLLELIAARLSCFSRFCSTLQRIADFCAEAETPVYAALLKKPNCIRDVVFLDGGYWHLMPQQHAFLLETEKRIEAERKKQEAEHDKEIAEAKQLAQKETFTSMNHSIRNLVSSVTNALYAAKNENDTIKTQKMINRARQGAGLIAAIANAISYSYRQSNGDWKKDLHATNGSVTMMKIVFTALSHSVPNVFAGEDFAQYRTVTEHYFVSNDELLKAENAWLDSATEDAKLKWIQDYLFNVSFDFDDTAKSLLIGDEHSTLTHFFILFNEIFWNTIKSVAYVEKERRQCHIRITCPDGFLVVDLENAANADHTSGNTGFGHIIIENYVKMFEIKDFKEYFNSNTKTYKLHFSLPIS